MGGGGQRRDGARARPRMRLGRGGGRVGEEEEGEREDQRSTDLYRVEACFVLYRICKAIIIILLTIVYCTALELR